MPDPLRTWVRRVGRSAAGLGRVGADVARTVVSLPPPVTGDGISAWRETAADTLRDLVDALDPRDTATRDEDGPGRDDVVRPVSATPVDHVADTALVRRRFRQLLERSVDVADDPGEPALLDIVTQLTPDEARIVRHLADHGPVAVMDLYEMSLVGRAARPVLARQSMVAERAGCAHPERGQVYVDNLVRLGLVAASSEEVDDPEEYQLVEGLGPWIEASRELRRDHAVRAKARRGSLVLTALGRRFVSVCLGTPTDDGGTTTSGRPPPDQ